MDQQPEFGFTCRFPLFAITTRPPTYVGSVPQVFTYSVDDIKDALLLFTDEDLAQRFIDEKGWAKKNMPVELGDGPATLQVLHSMKANGFSLVTVDPSVSVGSGRRYTLTTVDRVIEAIRNASPG